MLVSLLIIIYVTFIALGLPDSTLGSSFPAIAQNLGIPSNMAGYLSPVVSLGTIVSSLLSDKLVRRFSTKWVTSVSVLLTALALFLFSFVTKDTVWAFFPIAIVMGLGAGGIDAALNNYVALHYKAIHMNWLHCSWGVGTTISPLIIGSFIDSNNNSSGWNHGILTVSILLFAVSLMLFVTLPIWNKAKEIEEKRKVDSQQAPEKEKKPLGYGVLFRNPIFYLAMVGFFCYCAMEGTTGLWLSTYLTHEKGLSTSLAATLGSTFYIGITVGRFFSGPLSLRLNEKAMIRIGESIALIGVMLCLIPVNEYFAIVGFVITGLGCAPINPAIIRSTPYRFSKQASQKAMGLEMAIAYMGNLAIPPLFALTAKAMDENYGILPYFTLILVLVMILCHEIINRKLSKRDTQLSEEERKDYVTEDN